MVFSDDDDNNDDDDDDGDGDGDGDDDDDNDYDDDYVDNVDDASNETMIIKIYLCFDGFHDH